MADSHTLQDSQNLSIFLATQNKIRNTVKENLEKVIGYEELLSDVINLCVDLFETKMYLTPTEKHMLIKNLEVVPLFGDVQIAPFNYIKRSKHFDPEKWAFIELYFDQ